MQRESMGAVLCLFFAMGLGRIAATAHAQEFQPVEPSAADADRAVESVALAPQGVLTLWAALDLALRENPGLRAGAASVRAAEARVRQVRALPNPELEFSISEYDRSSQGFDAAEVEMTLSQRLELGGKRRWRTRQAQAEEALTGWDATALRLDVRAETTRRHGAVVGAQRRLALAAEAVAVAEMTAVAVEERVKAGKEPPFRTAKVKADLELARLGHVTARQTLVTARSALAALWGSDQAQFETAEDRLASDLPAPADVALLLARLPSVPELARREHELRLRQAALAAERAQRLPDVEVFASLKRFEEDGSHAFAFGVALPLPLFDRNDGNIEAARHELNRTRDEWRAVEVALKADLTEAQALAAAAHGRALALQGDVIPAMTQAFEAAREGYQQGKLGFLDLLDAQSGLAETQLALVDALEAYHNARTCIERLTATDAANSLIFENEGTEG